MSGEVEMEYGAMTTAADAQHDAVGQVDEIDRLREGATIPAGSLGKLPQSGEIQASFDDAWSGMGVALDNLGKAFEGIAQRLTAIRDDHRELDDAVGQTFTRMKGH
jgi:hypothetical protein